MQPIFIIGYMGSGKSTLGRELAKAMNREFIDLDNYIENRFHATVKDLFRLHGEEGFRNIERRMMLEVADFEDVVVACGGGTPCFSDNMEQMSARGLTIWLDVPIDRLVLRLTKPTAKAKRPLIANKSDDEIRSFIEDALRERIKYYGKATMIFDATNIETAADTTLTAGILLNQIKQMGFLE